MTDPIAIDLSHYQGAVDFSKVRASGVLGVIAKATESNTDHDASYKANREGATAAGLAFASYHFLRPSPDPATQAAYFLDFAAPGQGERVVCDWEDAGVDVAVVEAFMQRIQAMRPDLELTVYCSPEFPPAQGKSAWLGANTSLWAARYTSAAALGPIPPTWKSWSLWQYSQTGRVQGVNGAVDINRFNGSDANFLKWMGPAKTPAPRPSPAAAITLTIAGPAGTQLVVNGVPITL